MNKDFISPRGEQALIRIAEWLEAGAPHVKLSTGEIISDFDMTTPGTEHSCGTSCCIAGAVVAFNLADFPQFLNVDDRGWFDWGNEGGNCEIFTSNTVGGQAMAYLGISEDDAEALFMPDDMEYKTSAEGAAVIRNYLATGIVEWPAYDHDDDDDDYEEHY